MSDIRVEQDVLDLGSTGMELDVRRVNLLDDIEAREPNIMEIWYGHSILTATLFPPAQPSDDVDFVSKSNGRLEYMLEAGVTGDGDDRKRRFPFGKYPRLLMAWMAKQIRAAKGHKTRNVDPETKTITIPSIYQLCEEMGLPHGGRTAKSVQEQLELLLACRISIRASGTGKGLNVRDTAYLPIVQAVRIINDEKNVGYSGATFRLTDEVYERLSRESAPFDTRVSTYLLKGRSVMPYDIYIWLTGSMKNLRRDLPVSWDWLYERFGDQIAVKKSFRRMFRQSLEKVKKVYPGLNVECPTYEDYIILHPSPTSVPTRAVREVEVGANGDVFEVALHSLQSVQRKGVRKATSD